MAEEQKKPRTLWESALKVVKGDSTEQLVEQFTAEMTLVAEGLYDDQARLKREVELLRRSRIACPSGWAASSRLRKRR